MKEGGDEGALVELDEPLCFGGFFVKDEGIAPSAYDQGSADEIDVTGTFGGGEKTVQVKVQYHTDII